MSKTRKASKRVGLTIRSISAMEKPKTGRAVIHDRECRGLGVARYLFPKPATMDERTRSSLNPGITV